MEPVRGLGQGKPVPNWPKLVDRYKITTFCGTQLREFETAIRKEIKSGPSKTRWAFTDEGYQEVRKRLTIFEPGPGPGKTHFWKLSLETFRRGDFL